MVEILSCWRGFHLGYEHREDTEHYDNLGEGDSHHGGWISGQQPRPGLVEDLLSLGLEQNIGIASNCEDDLLDLEPLADIQHHREHQQQIQGDKTLLRTHNLLGQDEKYNLKKVFVNEQNVN